MSARVNARVQVIPRIMAMRTIIIFVVRMIEVIVRVIVVAAATVEAVSSSK